MNPEAQAAEQLLAIALRDREEADRRIEWLRSVIERGRGGSPSVQDPPKPRRERTDDGGLGYGAVKAKVEAIMEKSGKPKMSIREIGQALVNDGVRPNLDSAMISARNAMRRIIIDGKAKKRGLYYYVLTDKGPG